ncbi:MAG: PEP-CTERM sorting domain-containing protein [Planctomycetaceae bacterium]|nr:PEP-CTERM sorting domain-containing protein [Planctomycetaceae bacterium]
MKTNKINSLMGITMVLLTASVLNASVISETYTLNKSTDDGMAVAGLSAQAVFVWDDATPNLLKISLRNTSTSVPGWFGSADQILTSLSFDLGGVAITGGTATIASGSQSVSFDGIPVQLTGGAVVSGEWGLGNSGSGSSPLLTNVISAMRAHTETRFSNVNLDGPTNLDGPEGGIVTSPALVSLGGLGAVADCINFDLTLSGDLTGLGFLNDGQGLVAEFGSDAAFVTVPEPATMSLLAACSLAVVIRRRRIGGAE